MAAYRRLRARLHASKNPPPRTIEQDRRSVSRFEVHTTEDEVAFASTVHRRLCLCGPSSVVRGRLCFCLYGPSSPLPLRSIVRGPWSPLLLPLRSIVASASVVHRPWSVVAFAFASTVHRRLCLCGPSSVVRGRLCFRLYGPSSPLPLKYAASTFLIPSTASLASCSPHFSCSRMTNMDSLASTAFGQGNSASRFPW